MKLSIRHICFDGGERYMLLADEDGMPLYYPTLYITVVVRGNSKAANTIQNTLTAIKALYTWQSYAEVDLEARFSCGHLLEEPEVHALRDFLQQPLRAGKPVRKVISITPSARRPNTVSLKVQYSRMTVIADYLAFLAKQFPQKSEEHKKCIERMASQIRANRPKISNKSAKGRDEIHLDDGLLDRLEEVLKPGSEINPATNIGVQVRNALMFCILRVTGMRRGELLNLKIEDIDFSANTMSVIRRPDSKGDVRTYQPVAKTRERKVPIDPLLTGHIHDYVLKHRSKVPGSKKHGYLFVTHRSGPSCGRPLSISGFSKFIREIRNIATEFKGIHAHALRHSWNYTFSKLCDEKGLTPEREEKLRSYLMGWSETSGTAATYNKRHIKEEAGKSVLELQERYFAKKKRDKA